MSTVEIVAKRHREVTIKLKRLERLSKCLYSADIAQKLRITRIHKKTLDGQIMMLTEILIKQTK